MNKNAKIYVAGHRGLVGLAIVRNLQAKGYANLLTRTHAELDLTNQAATDAFFAKEKPDYVFLAAAKVGRSQDILLFEIGSLIWLLTGVLLLMRGGAAVKAQWFALFFMLFMIPLPGAIVDAVTMPMKMAVSHVADTILFAVGYPIARTGVVLQIGQYQLLVADACAGLHTLFSLEALGLLYLNIVRYDSLFRVSSIDPEIARAYDIHASFINQLLAAITPEQRLRLAGSFGKI